MAALRLNKSARNLLEVKQNAGRFFFRTTFIHYAKLCEYAERKAEKVMGR